MKKILLSPWHLFRAFFIDPSGSFQPLMFWSTNFLTIFGIMLGLRFDDNSEHLSDKLILGIFGFVAYLAGLYNIFKIKSDKEYCGENPWTIFKSFFVDSNGMFKPTYFFATLFMAYIESALIMRLSEDNDQFLSDNLILGMMGGISALLTLYNVPKLINGGAGILGTLAGAVIPKKEDISEEAKGQGEDD